MSGQDETKQSLNDQWIMHGLVIHIYSSLNGTLAMPNNNCWCDAQARSNIGVGQLGIAHQAGLPLDSQGIELHK